MRVPRTNERGVTAVEMLVGISIAALILVFVTHAIMRFVDVGFEVAEKTQALYLAEEGLEYVSFIRDESWGYIDDLSDGTTYYLSIAGATIATSTSPEIIGDFTRSFELETVERDGNDDIVTSGTGDSGSRYVTVEVSWGTPTQTVSLTSIIANIVAP